MQQLVLARYLNKRLIELYPNTRGETIGVLRRDGSYAYRPWLGFVDRARAPRMGKPVKLQVARVGQMKDTHVDWRDVPRGRHVQGCLTREGAYAVTEVGIRVV